QHLRLSLFLRTLVSALCPYTTLFRSWSCTSTRGLPLLKNLWLWKNHRFQNQPSSGFAKRFLPAHPAKPPLGQAPQSAQSAQLGPVRLHFYAANNPQATSLAGVRVGSGDSLRLDHVPVGCPGYAL